MKNFSPFLSILCLLIAQNISAQNDELRALITRGDSAYAAFDNKAALDFYNTALEKEPDNFAAMWRSVRAYSDVGEAEQDKEIKRALFETADSLAHRCVALYPDSADAHFVLAIAVGRMALFVGGKQKISYSKEIESAAKTAIALDPAHDGAHHVLGRWHYEIATLSWLLKAAAKVMYGGVPPGASLEASAEHLQKATELAPEKILHHLEYARTLIKLERYTEARHHLEQCTTLPATLWDDAARKAEAAELLHKIRDKEDKN